MAVQLDMVPVQPQVRRRGGKTKQNYAFDADEPGKRGPTIRMTWGSMCGIVKYNCERQQVSCGVGNSGAAQGEDGPRMHCTLEMKVGRSPDHAFDRRKKMMRCAI